MSDTKTAPKPLAGAAKKAAEAKAAPARLEVLKAGLVDRQHAAEGDDFDPVALALEKLDDLTGANKQLERKLVAQKGAVTKAKKEAAAFAGQVPDKPRAIGPIDKPLDPRELLELIADADTVEIGFSDGTTEIPELAPREIAGGKTAFHVLGNGLRLMVPDLTVHGPRVGERPYRVGGYGLFLDGELAAYAGRTEMLTIAPAGIYQLKDDVVF